MPLEKESLNNFLPNGFETLNQEGYKENFNEDKIATGFERDVPDIVSGPNLNNLLDNIGKNTNVLTKFMDFIKNMPINNIFVVDENNQLAYKPIDEVGGGGLEIGDIGFTQMAIDESKGKRRILNGQLIIQEQYLSFTNILKNSVALNPDLACTESEWQTAVTMSTNGVCEKFVIDDDAGTIRLPKYPQYLDLSINTSAVSRTVSIQGNGKSLGLTNGSENCGLARVQQNGTYLIATPNAYNANISTSASFSVDTLRSGIFGVIKDSSKSGLTGSVSIPAVQSEKIKGTYFIQVATGAETEDNIINEIELNNPFSLLDYKYSEYELNNLSWLRSNGQYNSKAVYPAVYDLLLRIYNGTETKAGVSVKLSTGSYTDYDFVLNTAEETFRLPIKVKLASGKAVVGNGMALGLTNGTNFSGLGISGMALANDVNIYGDKVATSGFTTNSGLKDLSIAGVTTDATKSGIETSDSDLYLYFYVGETVQNANLINAGRIEEKVADIKASLVDKLDKSAVKAYITETYVSGTSWYRIWSDKWCEQGGQTSISYSQKTATITLLKPYKNTNYNIGLSLGGQSGSGVIQANWQSKTNNNFVIYGDYSHETATAPTNWRTCGYIS